MLNQLFGNKKETRKFKTNINCGKCTMAVTPYVENVEGLKSWDVDLKSPDRLLIVKGNVDETELADALNEAGYTLGEEVK